MNDLHCAIRQIIVSNTLICIISHAIHVIIWTHATIVMMCHRLVSTTLLVIALEHPIRNNVVLSSLELARSMVL